MSGKISYAELMSKLNEPETSAEEIQEYFKEAPNPSDPFSPRFAIDETKVELPVTGPEEAGIVMDIVVGLLNRAHVRWRQRAYERRIRKGWRGLRFVAEGDSWFEYPLRLNDDLIDFLTQPFAIYCLSAAADEFNNMLRPENRAYIADVIRNTEAHGLLFSGGGNDIAGEEFVDFLQMAEAGADAKQYVSGSYGQLLDRMGAQYRSFLSELFDTFPDLKVFIHGYDHALPVEDGSWLGPSLKKKQIPESVWAGIVAVMIDRYNAMLSDLAEEFPDKFIHVNCVGAIGKADQWRDEMHGKSPGCQRAADRFVEAITGIWPDSAVEAAPEVAEGTNPEAAIETAAAEAAEAPDLEEASEEQLQEGAIIPDEDIGVESALSEEPSSLEAAIAESEIGRAAWPADDRNAPDYAHLNLPASGRAFHLTPDDLELLIRANHFEPVGHDGMIVFGLRGAALQSGHEISNATSLALKDLRPNHLTFRCVMGFYDRGTRRLWGYTASTVPNASYVRKYYKWQSGLGDETWTNMLSTGCYTFRRASHGWNRRLQKWRVPIALRLTLPGSAKTDGTATVLRSKYNAVYETDDYWHKTVPTDNIHPAFSTTAFSSAGCLTIRGSTERYTNNASGQWKRFLSHIGAIPLNGRIDLVLLTGAEAAIASALRVRGMSNDAAEIRSAVERLRVGSRGETVKQLQRFLQTNDDGVFGPGTRLALTEKQKTVAPLGRADSVYSPRMDVLFGQEILTLRTT